MFGYYLSCAGKSRRLPTGTSTKASATVRPSAFTATTATDTTDSAAISGLHAATGTIHLVCLLKIFGLCAKVLFLFEL